MDGRYCGRSPDSQTPLTKPQPPTHDKFYTNKRSSSLNSMFDESPDTSLERYVWRDESNHTSGIRDRAIEPHRFSAAFICSSPSAMGSVANSSHADEVLFSSSRDMLGVTTQPRRL